MRLWILFKVAISFFNTAPAGKGEMLCQMEVEVYASHSFILTSMVGAKVLPSYVVTTDDAVGLVIALW
jgi:hypothetical protein